MLQSLKTCFLLALFWPVSVLAEATANKHATTVNAAPVDPLSVSSIVNMFLGLGLVIGVILGMAWLVRRMGGFQVNGSQQIRLLGGMSLGPREKVVLLQVENKRLLVGVAQGFVNTLHVLDGEYTEQQSKEDTGTSNFRDKLLQALQKKSES
jgi:flagellar protein FliO/FliZ